MKNPFHTLRTNTATITALELRVADLEAKVAAFIRDDQQIAALRGIQKAVEYSASADKYESLHPDPEVIRAREIPLDQLKAELESENRRVEATEKDNWQSLNAERWMASQPKYVMNPANGKKLADEVERRGYRGSVMELQECFEYLVNRGEIVPRPLPPAPVRLYSDTELRTMPMDELKRITDEAARNGVL